jgi:hypothetical protein
MTAIVPVEFEDGLLQNRAIFEYLEGIGKQVPDMVQDKETKAKLVELKKEITGNINQIDQSEKQQINEMINVFHEKNADVWNARLQLTGFVNKIKRVNDEFDARRRQESSEAISLFVQQVNVDYKLVGTRYELTPTRFASVDALTGKGELKQTIKDKIVSAALQAQANMEQEELLEAARRDKIEKERQLAEKERELKQREADIARQENSDVQAMQAQIEQERASAQAKAKALQNVQNNYQDKQSEIIGRLTALENQIDTDKSYSGKSVLNMIKKIKEMLK